RGRGAARSGRAVAGALPAGAAVTGRLRRLATLEAAVEAETAFGGRTRSWSEVAALWVDLKTPTGRERAQGGQRPVLTESAQAEARDHPLAAAGQRLALDGDNW